MTDPIGTAQERELIEKLGKGFPVLVKRGDGSTETIYAKSLPVMLEAAGALQSRIAEVERLRNALNLCRERFSEYVTLHKAKLRPERARVGNQHARNARNAEALEKVARNQDMVDLCDAALSQHGIQSPTEEISPTAFSPCVEIDALWQMLDMGKCGADDQRCVARWLVDLHREHAALCHPTKLAVDNSGASRTAVR